MKKNFFSHFFSPYIIKIGSTRTIVISSEKKTVCDEPALVAVSKETNEYIAFGSQALELSRLGTHDLEIKALFSRGAVTDEQLCTQYLLWLRAKMVDRTIWKILPIPAVFVTSTDLHSPYLDMYREAATAAHFLPLEFIPGILGDNQAIKDLDPAQSRIIVHIGGSFTQIALVAADSIIESIDVPFGGNDIDSRLQLFVYDHYGIHIPLAHFSPIKEGYTKANETGAAFSAILRGRESKTGKIQSIQMTGERIESVFDSFFTDLFENFFARSIRTKSAMLHQAPQTMHWYLAGGLSNFPQSAHVLSRMIDTNVEVLSRPASTAVFGVATLISKRGV